MVLKRFVLLAFLAAANISYADNSAPDGNSAGGFFESLKNGISNAADAVAKAAKQSTQNITDGASSDTPLFTPIDPKTDGQFEGLFDGKAQTNSIIHKVAWPRVSLVYLKYGADLKCWTIRATIWKSEASHHNEEFQVCDVPVAVKDDLGRVVYVKEDALVQESLLVDTMRAPGSIFKIKNSGERRTAGPLPPERMFDIVTSTNLSRRINDINVRLAYISGLLNIHNEKTIYDGMSDPISNDFRMWYWKFEQADAQ